MDQPPPRPVTQRKRSYSTTAYSSLEEDHRSVTTSTSTLFSGTSGVSPSTTGQQAAQPTCLLATAVGTQVLTYEFIDNGTVTPFSSSASTGAPSKQQQQQQHAPIVPGQFDGIQMSNERTTFTMASLRWSPDSKCFRLRFECTQATVNCNIGSKDAITKQLEDTHYSRLRYVSFSGQP